MYLQEQKENKVSPKHNKVRANEIEKRSKREHRARNGASKGTQARLTSTHHHPKPNYNPNSEQLQQSEHNFLRGSRERRPPRYLCNVIQSPHLVVQGGAAHHMQLSCVCMYVCMYILCMYVCMYVCMRMLNTYVNVKPNQHSQDQGDKDTAQS